MGFLVRVILSTSLTDSSMLVSGQEDSARASNDAIFFIHLSKAWMEMILRPRRLHGCPFELVLVVPPW